MGRRRSVLLLSVQISAILLVVVGLVVGGLVLDVLAGSSPVATLVFLVLGVALGTSLMVTIVVKSFAQASSRRDQASSDGHGVPGRDQSCS